MKALRATVSILLDPREIGPDAETEWTTDASAADWMSETLSHDLTVLDWQYDVHWFEVEVDPETYEEGDMA